MSGRQLGLYARLLVFPRARLFFLESLHSQLACSVLRLEGGNRIVQIRGVCAPQHFPASGANTFFMAEFMGGGFICGTTVRFLPDEPGTRYDKSLLMARRLQNKATSPIFLHNGSAHVRGPQPPSLFAQGHGLMSKLTFPSHPLFLGFDQLERLVERTAAQAPGKKKTEG